jgi:hypothetical protein
LRILKWFPLAIVIALLTFQVAIRSLPPEPRLIIWHILQLDMPLAGLLCLIGEFIYVAVRKRWASPIGWVTLGT